MKIIKYILLISCILKWVKKDFRLIAILIHQIFMIRITINLKHALIAIVLMSFAPWCNHSEILLIEVDIFF